MHPLATPSPAVVKSKKTTAQSKYEYAKQSERLGQYTATQENDDTGSTTAVEVDFVTPQDPVVKTANGGRLPTIPIDEAIKLNKLKNEANGEPPDHSMHADAPVREAKDGTVHGATPQDISQDAEADAPLRHSMPPSRTNPLFPPLPLYGPPTILRSLQCYFFRLTSFFLSLAFLLVIILGAAFTGTPYLMRYVFKRATFRNPDSKRPFYKEEMQRKKQRAKEEHDWAQNEATHLSASTNGGHPGDEDEFVPTEGGPDPLVCDVGYYARREGLDVETFKVQTEDGFIIELQHLYNPKTERPSPPESREPHSPTAVHPPAHPERHASPTRVRSRATSRNPSRAPSRAPSRPSSRAPSRAPARTSTPRLSPQMGPPTHKDPKKYPVLLLHGLLQSSGAYCCTGPSSLAFYLAKAGYDVWLGNNRCGFKPRHTLLRYPDPRMWAWNIRQMGVLDLAAMIARVLSQTGSPKLALVAHSQGTTQTLVALAKEQRPDLGAKISVFCALAPAAYAGPLIGKAYFKFMHMITPSMFRCVFGIHSFIPFMMTMHSLLPGQFYGDMGYLVFGFLFNWSDARWDRGLRARCFQFSPTYVSAESMRWWLGRECFARQKCILATREEGRLEDVEDEEEDELIRRYYEGGKHTSAELASDQTPDGYDEQLSKTKPEERGKYAWYDENFPPLALWVAGADDLVDGRRLLRRFDRGREPHVKVVHKKIIEGYEHLDVIWALDSIDQVGSEVKDVIWRTMPEEMRRSCKTPHGCEDMPSLDLNKVDSKGPSVQQLDQKLEQAKGLEINGLEEQSARKHRAPLPTLESYGPLSPDPSKASAEDWAEIYRLDRISTV